MRKLKRLAEELEAKFDSRKNEPINSTYYLVLKRAFDLLLTMRYDEDNKLDNKVTINLRLARYNVEDVKRNILSNLGKFT